MHLGPGWASGLLFCTSYLISALFSFLRNQGNDWVQLTLGLKTKADTCAKYLMQCLSYKKYCINICCYTSPVLYFTEGCSIKRSTLVLSQRRHLCLLLST